ncbi:hypothetical protein [Mesorhizobium sp. M7A.F.Ca.MR.176.00.0.0]|uniref:hypothetical protein n=1 Tax=Mesorhizobium sp. M7A.F.Ca.MR.176.00.0.0 TaxID=2496776 RepID=UPI0013E28B25|nr:hypothetical protein [Mesorhizobium sp. M7A.F.Ca.MR.176.00.0.0]
MTDKTTETGLYKCPGIPPFVCIMERNKASFITQEAYRAGGYKPDFDAVGCRIQSRQT